MSAQGQPWMGEVDETAMCCSLCDWWFPTHDDVGAPIEEWLWKACAVMHGLFVHPKQHFEATGHIAEERLALYKQELGATFAPIKQFALGEHLVAE